VELQSTRSFDCGFSVTGANDSFGAHSAAIDVRATVYWALDISPNNPEPEPVSPSMAAACEWIAGGWRAALDAWPPEGVVTREFQSGTHNGLLHNATTKTETRRARRDRPRPEVEASWHGYG
jgi:hypothetical protein